MAQGEALDQQAQSVRPAGTTMTGLPGAAGVVAQGDGSVDMQQAPVVARPSCAVAWLLVQGPAGCMGVHGADRRTEQYTRGPRTVAW
jgi:hypothetical protein